MKYLLIIIVLTALLTLLYFRVRPYLRLVRKILGAMNGTLGPDGVKRSVGPKGERKLIRCATCGTWVPATRAIGAKTKAAAYCSTACLEKASVQNTRKAVG